MGFVGFAMLHTEVAPLAGAIFPIVAALIVLATEMFQARKMSEFSGQPLWRVALLKTLHGLRLNRLAGEKRRRQARQMLATPAPYSIAACLSPGWIGAFLSIYRERQS